MYQNKNYIQNSNNINIENKNTTNNDYLENDECIDNIIESLNTNIENWLQTDPKIGNLPHPNANIGNLSQPNANIKNLLQPDAKIQNGIQPNIQHHKLNLNMLHPHKIYGLSIYQCCNHGHCHNVNMLHCIYPHLNMHHSNLVNMQDLPYLNVSMEKCSRPNTNMENLAQSHAYNQYCIHLPINIITPNCSHQPFHMQPFH